MKLNKMKPKKENYYYSNFTRLFIDSIINPFSEDKEDILIDNYKWIWQSLLDLDKDKYEIWTVTEGDRNVFCVSKGFHIVNRIGYLITIK